MLDPLAIAFLCFLAVLVVVIGYILVYACCTGTPPPAMLPGVVESYAVAIRRSDV